MKIAIIRGGSVLPGLACAQMLMKVVQFYACTSAEAVLCCCAGLRSPERVRLEGLQSKALLESYGV